MERMIHRFRQTIAGARPWVTAAVAVAAGLSLYFAAQGFRYYQAAGSNSDVREQIATLERATGPQLEGNAEQEARLEAAEFRLENLRRLFDYPAADSPDSLMKIVSNIAEEAGLDLVSMTAEEIKVELRGVLQYQVRPIFVILDGPTDNVQEFLAILHNRVPVVVASSAKIVNLDTAPSTQIQLRFYLFPEPFFGEGEETAS